MAFYKVISILFFIIPKKHWECKGKFQIEISLRNFKSKFPFENFKSKFPLGISNQNFLWNLKHGNFDLTYFILLFFHDYGGDYYSVCADSGFPAYNVLDLCYLLFCDTLGIYHHVNFTLQKRDNNPAVAFCF